MKKESKRTHTLGSNVNKGAQMLLEVTGALRETHLEGKLKKLLWQIKRFKAVSITMIGGMIAFGKKTLLELY